MPLNLIKKYNDLLDFGAYNEFQRKQSLQSIFDRDISNNPNFSFRKKPIQPTPKNGEISMAILFSHLTTVIVDRVIRKRDFELDRSRRLHWIKFHLEEQKHEDMMCFSVHEPEGIRTYIYDKVEKYVIVLEPLREINEYYLLTAYHLKGKDVKRDKMLKKHKRKLDEIF